MNLRELTRDQEAILAQVESGDFTLEDVSDHLELLEGERNKKIESYLHVINRLSSESVTLSNELNRIMDLTLAKAKSIQNVKAWLLMSMKDGEKYEFDLFKVSRVKGHEVVSITSEKDVPESLKSFKPSVWNIDKKLVLQELKAGKNVKGAEIVTGKPSLRIK